MANGFTRPRPEEYREQLFRLLPPGPIWVTELGTRLAGFLLAVGDELARVHSRTLDLLDIESDWTKTDELLKDWERVAGLPDICNDNPSTDQTVRRQTLHAKMTAVGGQSPHYFKTIADRATGEDCTVSESLGTAPFHWDISVPNNDVEEFKAGQAKAGDELANYASGVDELFCLLERIKPAHTVLTYTFPNNDPET
jgi:uncharacterized protein YmfQ (DUF2313 family)